MAKEEAFNSLQTQADVVVDENSGISKEDQQEIIAEIEQIAKESKIKVTPELFNVSALKNGLIFPMLVNLVAVFLLVGGLFTLYSFFQFSESQLIQEEKLDLVAEGKLIKELKKQSEAQLNEKNQQINDIQGQLQNINKEREDLLSNMDTKIKEKEEVLRKSLETELEAERQRLKQSGVSEEEINKRIGALEAQKETAFKAQLETIKKETEQEKLRLENNFATLKNELNNNLTQINEEKKTLQAEAQKRENELRLQLEEKTKALESAKTATEAELSNTSTQLTTTKTQLTEAESSLKRMAEQKEKEELVQNQILGFYNSVKQHIVSGDFTQAISNLDTIKSYLNNESIVVLPGVLKRRDVEFFVVDSLKSMVESEMNKESVDTASLIASANLVTDLKTKVIKADEEYAKGSIEKAEKLYKEALNLLPELSRSHQYFIKKKEFADEEKQKLLNDSLTKAASAFELKDYAVTLSHYAKALSYLPVNDKTIEGIILNIRAAGFKLGLKELVDKDAQNAALHLQKAQTFFQGKQYNEAIVSYIDLIMRYPSSSQVESALTGISQSVSAKNQLVLEHSSSLQSELDERITALNNTIQAKIIEINALQEEKKTLISENQSLKTKIAELEKQRTALGGEIRVNQEQLENLKKLESVADSYNNLKYKYSEYALGEDEILKKQGAEGLVETKVYLDRFLASKEVAEIFPGLWERIKKYDNAFEKVGRDFTLQELSDIIYDLASLDTKGERLAYLEEEILKNTKEPLLAAFYQELKTLLK
jgi:septal ring factor EnvC (AmiA/AmiB activator)